MEAPPPARETPPGIPWGGLCWVAVLVLWLTWSPFLARETAPAILWTPSTSLGDWTINLLLLLPAGMVLGLGAGAPGGRRRWLRVILPLVALALLAEGGQLWIRGRHVSLFDTLLNLTGGAGGVWAAVRLRSAGHSRRSLALVVGSHLYFGMVVYVVAVAAHVGGGHELADWSPNYGVRVGGEFEAPREYRGEITDARICVPAEEGRACITEGADPGARERVARLATLEQHVSLHARVRSATDDQEGPARIITFSENEALRNATLAQRGRTLVLRLRTPLAGENGTRVTFELPDAVAHDRVTAVRGSYDEGRVVLRAEGEGRARGREFDYRLLTVGRLVAWSVFDYRSVQLAAASAVLLLAFFFPIGLATPLAFGGRTLLAGGVSAAAALVAFTVLSHQLAVGWIPAWFAAAMGSTVLGFGAGLHDRRQLARTDGMEPR